MSTFLRHLYHYANTASLSEADIRPTRGDLSRYDRCPEENASLRMRQTIYAFYYFTANANDYLLLRI